MPGVPYTTRLQKAGALIDEMRQIMLAWNEGVTGREGIVSRNLVASPSRMRMNDIVMRAFMPRFVESTPPGLWRPIAALDRGGWDRAALAAVHYYATAAAEAVLWDFVVGGLVGRLGSGQRQVGVATVRGFLDGAPDWRFPKGRWSDEVATRVARGLLAALRDFGALRGGIKKEIGTPPLPVESFAFIARIRSELGQRGSRALEDPCWRLFFLTPASVERRFVDAQQHGFLRYQAAGSVVRIDFPEGSLEEYASVLTR